MPEGRSDIRINALDVLRATGKRQLADSAGLSRVRRAGLRKPWRS